MDQKPNTGKNKTAGQKQDERPVKPRRKRWRRLIRYVIRKSNERRTEHEKKRTEEKEGEKAARSTARATWLIGVFTIVLALVGVLTLIELIEGGIDTDALIDASRKQARAADSFARSTAKINTHMDQAVEKLQLQVIEIQRQTRLDERPYIKVELRDEGTPAPATGNPVQMPLKLTNIGKTSALKVTGWMFVDVVSVGNEPPIPGKKGPHPLRPVAGIKTAVIYPGQPPTYFPASRKQVLGTGKIIEKPATQSEHDEIQSGLAYIAVWGTVRYYDMFGTVHWTKYCQAAGPNGSYVQSVKCAAYGEMDHN